MRHHLVLLIVALLFASNAFAASQGDVVVSEINWAGSSASSSDEWIELWNTRLEPIDLTGWQLFETNSGTTQVLSIVFERSEANPSCTIPARGFLLIDGRGGEAVTSASACTDGATCTRYVIGNYNLNQSGFSGGLSNNGEQLLLFDSVGLLVEAAGRPLAPWFAGSSNPRASMERNLACGSLVPGDGTVASSWHTNDGMVRNGVDSGGNAMNGTPGAPNSQWCEPPIADAGPDQNAYTGIAIGLAGTATDLNGIPIIEWGWAVESAPTGGRWDLWNWDTPAPTFAGYVPGDYVLSLRVSDAYYQSAPSFVTIHVADNKPPVAVVTVDRTSGPVPLAVCFDGSKSYDPEGGPLMYDWDLGDGANASTPTVCPYTYVTPGTYVVTFGVADERGATDFESITVTALQPDNRPPTASPTATPNTGTAPLTVQFAANATDADNDPLTYAWNFGDGGTSTDASPSHTYVAAGTYAAWITVSDSQASVSASLTIVVNEPVPAIELNVTKVDIDFKSKKSALADVSIYAELYAAMPAPDDVVALYVDGALVFAAPFGQFEPVKQHGAVVPGAYKLKTPHLWVQLDFTEGRLAVEAEKVKLTGYDSNNGVDIEVMLGDAMAVDNIQPVDDERGERHYKHRRSERGRGDCRH